MIPVPTVQTDRQTDYLDLLVISYLSAVVAELQILKAFYREPEKKAFQQGEREREAAEESICPDKK